MKRRILLATLTATSALLAATALAGGKQETFVGASPCTDNIKAILPVTCQADPGLIEWKLSLHHHSPDGSKPSPYELEVRYGPTKAGRPGLGDDAKVIRRSGEWIGSKGIHENPDAFVYRIKDGPSFAEVGGLLHVLSPDNRLMIGNGGWSFTLQPAEGIEKPVEARIAATFPEVSYKLEPTASGPELFGIFEGRTPCQGISKAASLGAHPGCDKAKWRVTLFQDARGKPSTYMAEGTLFQQGARKGGWTVEKNKGALTYVLASASGGAPIRLLRGDDDVLFFTGADGKPLIGSSNFAYTLNRSGKKKD